MPQGQVVPSFVLGELVPRPEEPIAIVELAVLATLQVADVERHVDHKIGVHV